jgi:FAD/FMN-containing dehydrogenase
MSTASLIRPTAATAGPIGTGELALAFRAECSGDVLTGDDTSFPAATFGIDPSGTQPEIVVIAADAGDVAATVRLANRAGRRVVVQTAGSLSGPASAAGSPIVLIVTRLLAQVRIDPAGRTARVGVGASWRQVQQAAAKFGLSAVSGPASGTGALGYQRGERRDGAGAGYSPDHIHRLEVVTPQGAQIVLDQSTDPAEFRAQLRRRPEFGVVTAMTIELVPADQVYAGGIWFDADDADTVLRHWRILAADLPPAATTTIARHSLPASALLPSQLRARSVVHVRYTQVGDPAGGAHLFRRLRRAAAVVLDCAGPR